jgi:hypothetical protein
VRLGWGPELGREQVPEPGQGREPELVLGREQVLEPAWELVQGQVLEPAPVPRN